MSNNNKNHTFVEKILCKVEDYLNLTSAGIIVFMLLLVSVSVIMRRTMNRPIAGAYEGSELCMIMLVYLGMAFTHRRGKNIRVTVIYDTLSETKQRIIDFMVLPLSIIFWSLLTWQSAIRAIYSWQMRESSLAVVEFPLYPGWTIIPIGAGLLTIRLLVEFWELINHNGRK